MTQQLRSIASHLGTRSMGGEELFFRVGWLVGYFVHEVGSGWFFGNLFWEKFVYKALFH